MFINLTVLVINYLFINHNSLKATVGRTIFLFFIIDFQSSLTVLSSRICTVSAYHIYSRLELWVQGSTYAFKAIQEALS